MRTDQSGTRGRRANSPLTWGVQLRFPWKNGDCVSLAELEQQRCFAQAELSSQEGAWPQGWLVPGPPGPRAVLQLCCFHSSAVSPLSCLALNSFLLD